MQRKYMRRYVLEKSWKIRSWTGIRTLTSAMPVQCSTMSVELSDYQANWEQDLVIKWVDYKLVDLETNDRNTGIFNVYETRIGMNEFDHRIFKRCLSSSEKGLRNSFIWVHGWFSIRKRGKINNDVSDNSLKSIFSLVLLFILIYSLQIFQRS